MSGHPAETPRIAPSAPRYGPQGPGAGGNRPQAFCALLSACRRFPFRTVWDELGYLHDRPATGESVPACAGCLERSSDS